MSYHPTFIERLREQSENATFAGITESIRGQEALLPVLSHYGPAMPKLARQVGIGLDAFSRIEAACLDVNGWLSEHCPNRGHEPDLDFVTADANRNGVLEPEEAQAFKALARGEAA